MHSTWEVQYVSSGYHSVSRLQVDRILSIEMGVIFECGLKGWQQQIQRYLNLWTCIGLSHQHLLYERSIHIPGLKPACID